MYTSAGNRDVVCCDFPHGLLESKRERGGRFATLRASSGRRGDCGSAHDVEQVKRKTKEQVCQQPMQADSVCECNEVSYLSYTFL